MTSTRHSVLSTEPFHHLPHTSDHHGRSPNSGDRLATLMGNPPGPSSGLGAGHASPLAASRPLVPPKMLPGMGLVGIWLMRVWLTGSDPSPEVHLSSLSWYPAQVACTIVPRGT